MVSDSKVFCDLFYRYVDWSNVDSVGTENITTDTDDIAPGVVRLFAGHTDEIRSMGWWNPKESDINTDQCTSLLLTVTAKGSLRAWDINGRELLCQIKVCKIFTSYYPRMLFTLYATFSYSVAILGKPLTVNRSV